MGEDLTRSLTEAIGAISEQLRLRFAAAEGKDSGLGFVAMATLRHLVRHGPRTATELAETDHVTTQAISLRVAPLVEQGLLERQRDPQDARRTILRPSPAGSRLVAAAHARGHRALTDALAALTPQERDAVESALPALARLGNHLRDVPHPPATAENPIERFFEEFAAASEAGDWSAYEAMFLTEFLNLDPTSAGPVAREDLVALLPRRRALFESVGATGTSLTSLATRQLDERHVLAETTWTVRYEAERAPAKVPVLHSTFLLRLEDRWRVAVYLNHENLLQLLGVA